MISSTRSSRLGDPQMQHDGPRWVLSRVGSHALAWRGVATLQLRGGGRRARKYNPRNKKAQFTRKTRKSEGEAAGSTGGDQRGGEIMNAGRRGEGRTEDKPEGRRHGREGGCDGAALLCAQVYGAAPSFVLPDGHGFYAEQVPRACPPSAALPP